MKTTKTLRVQWSLPSEDYEGTSNLSTFEVDGVALKVTCNDVTEKYTLVAPPLKFDADYCNDWPVDPTDRRSVDEFCKEIFGVGLA